MDYAAATPLDERVMTAMQPYFSELFYNPSALYLESREVRSTYEQARHRVAQVIGSKPAEIIFTAGGTESTNLAIKGIMSGYPDCEVLVSAIEHEAVLIPSKRFNQQIIGVNKQGLVELSKLEAAITDKTVLVSIMLVNNEIGTVQPMAEISEIIALNRRKRLADGNSTPLYLHTDAAQAPLYIDCNVSRLGVDMMSLNGGKMHGPKQSGILYLRAGIELQPIIEGGGQEFGVRHGTENVPNVVGFAEALELAQTGRHDRAKAVSMLRDYFIQELENAHGAQITGHRKYRIANNIHATFEDTDNERVLFALDDLGVAAAAGSACSASKETASHVLAAIGLDEKQARSSLRFSIGTATTKEDIDQVVALLHDALKA